ncbi:MAG: hypothetical protein K0U98_09415 [Deltaproteobacteria bacterium]|nr:hypothetical protein [Deltaproteobacteria bacterium]
MRGRLIYHVLFSATLLLLSSVVQAEDGSRGVYLVSNDLFDALEGWSGVPVSSEEVALSSYPEVIRSYAAAAGGLYPERSLSEHFAQNYPAAAGQFEQVTGGAVTDDGDLITYVMGDRYGDYQLWQEEAVLQNGGTFQDYIARHHPQVVEQIEAANRTPAGQGVPLATFVGAQGREDLDEELRTILTPTDCPSSRCCKCWVVMTLPSQPYDFEMEELEADDVYVPPFGRRIDKYAVLSQGVARTILFELRLANHLGEKEITKTANYSNLRVRLLCTDDGVPGGRQCQGAACSGELAMAVEYGSRVFENIDVAGWPASRRAQLVAADTAFLRYDPPGPASEMTLFEKGVAVSGDFKTEWDSEAVIEVLLAGTELAIVIGTYGASAALSDDLGDRLLNGIVGLVKREGETGNNTEDMKVLFDTAQSVPFALTPNITHLFQLEAESKIYARGYGPLSVHEAQIQSSKYIAAVARNFQCSGGATAPKPGACWHWASGGAPHSSATLQNLVRDFIYPELGAVPTGLSSTRGCYYN